MRPEFSLQLMSEQNEMDKTPGKISWKELMTRDAEASAGFYRGLFGWVREEVDMGGSTYTFFKVGEESVAGMAVLSAKSEGTPEGWTNYVTVQNLEDSIAKARELGGKVCKDITALQMGRFAIVQDPHGAVVGLCSSRKQAQWRHAWEPGETKVSEEHLNRR